MSDDNNLTDRSYELVEMIEKRKKLLSAVAVICFFLVPVGIGIDFHIYMTATHQKGDWSDMSTAAIALISALTCLFLIVGIRKYTLIKDLKKKLDQMEVLEETIYNEVLSPKTHQMK